MSARVLSSTSLDWRDVVPAMVQRWLPKTPWRVTNPLVLRLWPATSTRVLHSRLMPSGVPALPAPDFHWRMRPVTVFDVERLSDHELAVLYADGYDVLEELVKRGLIRVH